MRGVFVTGTDTGVGKTVLTAVLVGLWRARGVDAVPAKPVQTGAARRGRTLAAPDLEFCLRANGIRASAVEQALMAPYRFAPACSPHLAAELAGREIELGRIADSLRRLGARHDRLVVEGAGGALVPVNRRATMLDLIRRLRLPVIVAARAGLGTINHTLLTLAALRAARCRVLGVVLVQSAATPWGWIETNNGATISRRGQVRVLGRLPYMPALAAGVVTTARFRGVLRAWQPELPALIDALEEN